MSTRSHALFRLLAAAVAIAVATPPSCAADAAKSKRHGKATTAHQRDAQAKPYGQRADAMQLAAQLAQAHGLDPAWTRATIAKARFQPSITRLIAPPPVPAAKNWSAYRERFVEPDRIGAGVAFWDANERWLAAARERYGVEPEVIVGIVGVETYYGRITGRFRILDALTTLALDYPAGASDRSAFFRDELGEWLALARREGLDAVGSLGSYAGAIGLGQFMPGSINRYAVDFDGDGRIDMNASAADVIGSIARYLAEHGWQPGMPTHYEVTPPPEGSDGLARLLGPDILPSFSAAQFTEAGAVLSAAGQRHNGLLALVELRNGDAPPSFVAGSANFYAVTRYNRSSYYAMAVIELGQAVAAQRLIDRLAVDRAGSTR